MQEFQFEGTGLGCVCKSDDIIDVNPISGQCDEEYTVTGCLEKKGNDCLLCDYDRKRVKNAQGHYICESTCLVDALLWETYIIYEETNKQQKYDPACKYCLNSDGDAWDDYCSDCDLITGKCRQCLDWVSDAGYTYAVSPDGYCEEV